jgi:hypothetical protein
VSLQLGFDSTAWQSLQFRDPLTGDLWGAAQFTEYLEDLTWTTVLSDGVTQLELKEGGKDQKVAFAERFAYARACTHARLHECAWQVHHIREGLLSIIPAGTLDLLTWRELELRVCGQRTVDLEVPSLVCVLSGCACMEVTPFILSVCPPVQTLKKHTIYSPAKYNRTSEPVRHFWEVLVVSEIRPEHPICVCCSALLCLLSLDTFVLCSPVSRFSPNSPTKKGKRSLVL